MGVFPALFLIAGTTLLTGAASGAEMDCPAASGTGSDAATQDLLKISGFVGAGNPDKIQNLVWEEIGKFNKPDALGKWFCVPQNRDPRNVRADDVPFPPEIEEMVKSGHPVRRKYALRCRKHFSDQTCAIEGFLFKDEKEKAAITVKIKNIQNPNTKAYEILKTYDVPGPSRMEPNLLGKEMKNSFDLCVTPLANRANRIYEP